ncbi:hypothetical protein Tco_1074213 [Tanacetum coccineum]
MPVIADGITGSRDWFIAELDVGADKTVDSPHGFIIHGIEVLKGNEKVTEVIDVENWWIDNSRKLRRIVSLIEQNSSVLSTKSSIQSTFRFR